MSSRRERGLTENIYLVKLDISETFLVFHALGTSHHVYKVTCPKGKVPHCTCPDHKIRKRTCKHMYFVCEKVIQVNPIDWEIIEDLNEIANKVVNRLPNLHVIADDYYTKMYNAYLRSGKTEGEDIADDENDDDVQIRNDECCVCLDDIDKKAPKDVMVCSTCKNGIHSMCWKKWSQVNGKNKCVYCRTKIEEKGKYAKVIEKSEWGVLLQ